MVLELALLNLLFFFVEFCIGNLIEEIKMLSWYLVLSSSGLVSSILYQVIVLFVK